MSATTETKEPAAVKPAHHEHHTLNVRPHTTRCKMTCQGKGETYGGGAKVTLGVVYDPDPSGVNHSFWKATPSGYIELYIDNPAGADVFQPGKAYYVDFQEAT